MNVLLATAGDRQWSRQLLDKLDAVARLDRVGEHSLVSDAEEAELILFVDLHQHPDDWRQRALRDHELVRAFPDRCFVYDERDVPRDTLPGIYVSMPQRRFEVRRHRAFAYYGLLTDTRDVASHEADLLFSFRGRRVGSLRTEVLSFAHPRAVVEDSSAHDFFRPDPSLERERARYRELIGRSKFVLCPRGAGTSSIRLYEAIAAGRVPVVLSDGWVPPKGVDWDTCSVRVPESQLGTLTTRLAALEPSWPAMSAAAAAVYRELFAPDVWFHGAVELCRELQREGRLGPSRQYLDIAFWRDGARRAKAGLTRS